MDASPSITEATWTEIDIRHGIWTLRLDGRFSFSVRVSGRRHYVVTPGNLTGRLCWSRHEAECFCREMAAQAEAMGEEPDEDEDERSYRANLRHEQSMSTYSTRGL